MLFTFSIELRGFIYFFYVLFNSASVVVRQEEDNPLVPHDYFCSIIHVRLFNADPSKIQLERLIIRIFSQLTFKAMFMERKRLNRHCWSTCACATPSASLSRDYHSSVTYIIRLLHLQIKGKFQAFLFSVSYELQARKPSFPSIKARERRFNRRDFAVAYECTRLRRRTLAHFLSQAHDLIYHTYARRTSIKRTRVLLSSQW